MCLLFFFFLGTISHIIALGNRRFSRGDSNGSVVRTKDKTRLMPFREHKNDDDDGDSPHLVLTDRMRQEFKRGEVSLQAKFEVFQKGIKKNPKILEALLRRRFSMVSIHCCY